MSGSTDIASSISLGELVESRFGATRHSFYFVTFGRARPKLSNGRELGDQGKQASVGRGQGTTVRPHLPAASPGLSSNQTIISAGRPKAERLYFWSNPRISSGSSPRPRYNAIGIMCWSKVAVRDPHAGAATYRSDACDSQRAPHAGDQRLRLRKAILKTVPHDEGLVGLRL